MPAPPMPTTWMRRGSDGQVESRCGSFSGHGHRPARRYGLRHRGGRAAEPPAPWPRRRPAVGEQRLELLGEPSPVTLGIRHVHRRAQRDDGLGVAGLVVVGAPGSGTRIAGHARRSGSSATDIAPARDTQTSAACW